MTLEEKNYQTTYRVHRHTARHQLAQIHSSRKKLAADMIDTMQNAKDERFEMVHGLIQSYYEHNPIRLNRKDVFALMVQEELIPYLNDMTTYAREREDHILAETLEKKIRWLENHSASAVDTSDKAKAHEAGLVLSEYSNLPKD